MNKLKKLLLLLALAVPMVVNAQSYFPKGVKADTIHEITVDAGVHVEGVIMKDGNIGVYPPSGLLYLDYTNNYTMYSNEGAFQFTDVNGTISLADFATLASPTFTGTVIIPTPFTIGAVSMTATGTELNDIVAGNTLETTIADDDSDIPTSGAVVDYALTAGDDITELEATAWRLFYSNNLGVIVPLSLGADGTYLRSNGGTASLTFDTPAGTGDLLADGTTPLTANWDAGAFTFTGTQFISDIAEGTAPFEVTSTTVVTGLNADELDGYTAADFLLADDSVHFALNTGSGIDSTMNGDQDIMTLFIDTTSVIATISDVDILEVRVDSLVTALADTAAVADTYVLKHIEFNTQTGTSYTTVLTDDGKVVTMNNAAASTLTIPPYTDVAYPEGTQISVIVYGAGTVTLTEGAAVTFISKDDLVALTTGSVATLIHTATEDTWFITGSLE